MSTKTLIWVGMFVGSFIGGYIPALWGVDVLSMTSIIFSTLGGIGGIFGGYYLSKLL